MSLRISIIIPHLNQPAFLERCLASLAPQIATFRDAEVIVVDNGSRELPSAVVGKYKWACLEQEREAGPGPARNRGIAVAKGDLLAFIDADCLAHPDWLAALVGVFDAHPERDVLGGDVRIALLDSSRPTMLEAYESVFAYRQEEYIAKHRFSGTGNLAMRRSAFDKVGAFAGIGIAEDMDWGRRADIAKVVIHYVPTMIVYHPARTTFAELSKKWDRHTVHFFNEKPRGLVGRITWLGLTAAVAVSAVLDLQKILASERIETWREAALAAIMLFRIRAYRAWRMAQVAFQRGNKGPQWNS